MNSTVRSLISFAVCLALSSIALGGELIQKTFDAKSYGGSRDRLYQVFVPSAYTASEPVPMVMVLHGCRQTEQNMVNETRFMELAERENFIVVYPFITTYDGSRNPNCWGFWFDQHTHEGAGEPEDLYQIGLEVESQFNIDSERRYITGLSSGAAMAVVVAVVHSEYFAAAGSAAGLPYSETSSSVGFVCANPGTFKSVSSVVSAMRNEQTTAEEQRTIPIMTIHSNNDCTVNMRGSESIRDSWLQRYGAGSTGVETLDCTHEGVACTHRKYGDSNRSVVETVFYSGQQGGITGDGAHYWVGDNAGEFANPTGPSATELFWDFFKRHPFGGNRPPVVFIDSATASGTSIDLHGSASDPDGTVAEVIVRLEGQHPQDAKLASGTTSWSISFDDLPDNTIYTPVAIAVDDKGATTRVAGAAVMVGTPPENQPPALTIDNVVVSGTCVALAGTASDADDGVVEVAVELGTRGFKPASFDGSRYAFEECGLTSGVYSTRARATDVAGATTTVSGIEVTVEALEIATASWLDHMNAGRLRVYGAPCLVGFGSCDSGFQTIFLTHGFDSFALYRAPDSNDWYSNPGNITAAPTR